MFSPLILTICFGTLAFVVDLFSLCNISAGVDVVGKCLPITRIILEILAGATLLHWLTPFTVIIGGISWLVYNTLSEKKRNLQVEENIEVTQVTKNKSKTYLLLLLLVIFFFIPVIIRIFACFLNIIKEIVM